MNQFLKVVLAITGGVNVIFSIFIPIAISLIITKLYNLDSFSFFLLIIVGCLSGLYRAIEVAGFDTIDYILDKFNDGRNTRKKHI